MEVYMSPIALTPPPQLKSAPRVRFKNLMFATDLAATSEPAQAYALLLARMFGSHLFALHVETGPGLSPRYEQAWRTLSQRGKNFEDIERCEQKIAELEDFFGSAAAPFTLLFEHGEVPEVLNRVVEEHA